jgi:lambda family phage portal protein
VNIFSIFSALKIKPKSIPLPDKTRNHERPPPPPSPPPPSPPPPSPPPSRKNTKRGYDAAVNDRFSTLFGSSGVYNGNADVIGNLQTLRAKSRELFRNNPYFAKLEQILLTNVVGSNGIRLQSKCVTANGKVDKQASAAIEASWQKYSTTKHCDYRQELSWREMCNVALQSLIKDGEIFAKLIYDKNNPWSFSVELLDADSCASNHYAILTNGNTVAAGIELDSKTGKKVAYWFKQRNNRTQIFYNENTQEFVRVTADQIIHYFKPQFVGQLRGLPFGVSVYTRAHNIKGYEEAAIISQRISASQSGFFEPTGESSEEFTGDEEELDNEGEPTGDFVMQAEPGVFRKIPAGYRLANFTPNINSQDFAQFMKCMLRGYATGFNVGYSAIASDYSDGNYSSLRLEALADRDAYKCMQTDLIEGFCQPIVGKWIEAAYLVGIIRVNGNQLRKSIDYYEKFEFQPRRWQWVDPAKEMNAYEKAIRLRLTSRSAIIRERGDDPETVFEEIANEEQYIVDAGSELVLQTYNQQQKTGSESGTPATVDNTSGKG